MLNGNVSDVCVCLTMLHQSQVFGRLLSTVPNEDLDETDSPDAGDADKEGKEDEVREHVVDILFNKGKISSIQKQV